MRQLYFSDTALKQLQKIPKNDLKRIKEKLERFCAQQNPLHLARKLVKSDLGTYRWRIGDWRVVFDVDKSGQIIIILVVGNRKDIYK